MSNTFYGNHSPIANKKLNKDDSITTFDGKVPKNPSQQWLNASPVVDKLRNPDGSITTFDGEVPENPSQQWLNSSAIVNKIRNPDGSIGLLTDIIEGGDVKGVKAEDSAGLFYQSGGTVWDTYAAEDTVGFEDFQVSDSVEYAAVETDIDFVLTEAWNENTAGTALTNSIAAIPGKDVIAVVTTRSATTFSDGWEVISSNLGFSSSAQNLYVVKKVAASNLEGLTVTQTSSARIYIQLISLAKNITITEIWKSNLGTADTFSSINVPDKSPGDKILWALSANFWETASPYGKWQTPPYDLMRCSSPDDIQDRQAVFVDGGDGAAVNRIFYPNSSGTGIGAIMLKIEIGGQ